MIWEQTEDSVIIRNITRLKWIDSTHKEEMVAAAVSLAKRTYDYK